MRTIDRLSTSVPEELQASFKAHVVAEFARTITRSGEPDDDEKSRRMVAVDTVIRGGSYIAAAISVMSILATILSGAIIIQPTIAVLMLIASIGFYSMTLVRE